MMPQSTYIPVIIVMLGAVLVGVLYWFTSRRAATATSASSRTLRELTHEYRERSLSNTEADFDDHDFEETEFDEKLTEHSLKGSSLQEKLKYAQLEFLPLWAVSAAQVIVSALCFILARAYLELPLQILSLVTGYMLVQGVLERRIRARVKRFDLDFPQFLLAVVGMLKTGLNPVQALEAAAANLEEESLVRQEVELMLERFRVGVPEERSIGSFGEDIAQPEIELFVQALILSRRVGGNLSETLDRLAKQVRRRHAFKLSASSTVTQQRGSLWVIVAVMVAVQLWIMKMSPEMVITPWTHPALAAWTQSTLVLIWSGVVWMKGITNIKI